MTNKTHWQSLVRWDEIIADYGDKWVYIDNLISSACISCDEKRFCENINTEDIDPELEQMLVMYLLQAQPDRIRMGLNYSQMDITNLLKKIQENDK